jgi:hypothetical protein
MHDTGGPLDLDGLVEGIFYAAKCGGDDPHTSVKQYLSSNLARLKSVAQRDEDSMARALYEAAHGCHLHPDGWRNGSCWATFVNTTDDFEKVRCYRRMAGAALATSAPTPSGEQSTLANEVRRLRLIIASAKDMADRCESGGYYVQPSVWRSVLDGGDVDSGFYRQSDADRRALRSDGAQSATDPPRIPEGS